VALRGQERRGLHCGIIPQQHAGFGVATRKGEVIRVVAVVVEQRPVTAWRSQQHCHQVLFLVVVFFIACIVVSVLAVF